MSDKQYSAYIRKSTEQQSDEHQRQDIKDWLDSNDVAISEVDIYSETGSGADSTRDEFTSLIQSIESGGYTDVVIWEVSRIARKGLLAQRFFDACEETNTTIHITNGSVRRIEADGTGRLVADIIASVAAEERRNLIRRTRSGQKQARKAGKWLGNPPVGFVVVDGFLKPNLDPDYDDGEAGFLDVVEALNSIDSGQSYNKTAENTPNVTRQTLSRIDKDEERRAWYLGGNADDDRVQEAIDDVPIEMDTFNSDTPVLWDNYFEMISDYDHLPDSIDDVDPFPYSIQYPSDLDVEVECFAEKLLLLNVDDYRYSVYLAGEGRHNTEKRWIARRQSNKDNIRQIQRQKYDETLERFADLEDALEQLSKITHFKFEWE